MPARSRLKGVISHLVSNDRYARSCRGARAFYWTAPLSSEKLSSSSRGAIKAGSPGPKCLSTYCRRSHVADLATAAASSRDGCSIMLPPHAIARRARASVAAAGGISALIIFDLQCGRRSCRRALAPFASTPRRTLGEPIGQRNPRHIRQLPSIQHSRGRERLTGLGLEPDRQIFQFAFGRHAHEQDHASAPLATHSVRAEPAGARR
jgi:phage-related protein